MPQAVVNAVTLASRSGDRSYDAVDREIRAFTGVPGRAAAGGGGAAGEGRGDRPAGRRHGPAPRHDPGRASAQAAPCRAHADAAAPVLQAVRGSRPPENPPENRKEKVKGRIARASIVTVWTWLSRTLLPEAASAYQSEVRALIIRQQFDDALARVAAFWTLAADAMTAAIANDRKAVRMALMSDAVLADAQEMALLLSAGQEIAAIQSLLPRLVPQLTDDMLHALRDIHDRLAASTADAAPYVAVVAMNRLVHPWEALKLPQLVTHQTQDTLISSTDMGLVGDLLFADIELHGGAVRGARHPVFDVHVLLDHLAHFTELSSSIVKEIDIRRDGKWGKRLLKDRAAIAEH